MNSFCYNYEALQNYFIYLQNYFKKLQNESESESHSSLVWLFVMLWTVTCQTPLSIEFSRPEYWSG